VGDNAIVFTHNKITGEIVSNLPCVMLKTLHMIAELAGHGSRINIRMNLSAVFGRRAQNASLRFAKLSEQLISQM